MGCSCMRKRLSAYVDGELREKWRRRVERHLAVCPVCREELERLRDVDMLLARGPDVSVPPFIAARVVARVRGEVPRRVAAPWWHPLLSPRLGYALATAALACGVLLGAHIGMGLVPILSDSERMGPIEILDLGSFRDEPSGSMSELVMNLIEEDQT